MRDRRSLRLATAIVLLGLACLAGAASADCGDRPVIGEIISLENRLTIVGPDGAGDVRQLVGSESPSEETAVSGEEARRLCLGDELRVGENGRVALRLHELSSVIRLDANTVFALGTAASSATSPTELFAEASGTSDGEGVLDYCLRTFERSWLTLRSGALRLFTTRPRRLNVRTPYLNAAIEGTEFAMLVDGDSARVQTTEGVVGVCNARGGVAPRAGQAAGASGANVPKIVTPDDAVQWALHYPLVGPRDDRSARESLRLLRAGQVDELIKTIEDSEDAFDLALRAIVAVTRNDTGAGRRLAERAVEKDGDLPAARLAQSYVRQAELDLVGALESIETAAATSAPREDVLARLAELQLVNGRAASALRTAREGVERFPASSRLRTVLGFVLLGSYALENARASFDEATALDESDPLPRLGLALVAVRRAREAEARRQLEIAVNLDPGRSLLRSYLGRVYAASGSSDRALTQLRLAEALDPRDPTPRLFRAFLLQRLGRPVDALADLQASVEGVDKRAVYRSRRMLDQDFSSTLAAEGRVYAELGFGELTRLVGAESLQRDPGSYAGHRLLADALLSRPLSDHARASEELQAQLRQPLNNNPAPIRLGDNRLGAFADAGPFALSLNEYTRAFSEEGVGARGAVLVGSHGTRAEELQLSALHARTSLALSGYRFRTDGIEYRAGSVRRTGDETLEIASALLEHQPSSAVGLQIEHSVSELEAGDDYFGFVREAPSPFRDRHLETRSRLGLRARLDDARELLANIEIARRREQNGIPGQGVPQEATENSVILDLQQILEHERRRVLAGLMASDESSQTPARDVSRRHLTGYGYAYESHALDAGRLDIVYGLSLDANDADEGDGRGGSERHANPAFGLGWRHGGTRVRFAGFRSVRRTLASARTLEPSQISGFPRLHDDPVGARSSTLAIGADRRAERHVAGTRVPLHYGAEWAHRRIRYAATACPSPAASVDEVAGFLYLPRRWLSAGLELGHTRWRGDDCAFEQERLAFARTSRLELELNGRFPNRTTLRLRPRYIVQDGDFPLSDGERVSGESRFWIVDAALEWKPDRSLGVDGATVSLSVGNLFDERFAFQDADPLDPGVDYERTVYFKAQVSLR